MNKVVLKQQAEDGLRRDLAPGERIAAGAAATSDAPRWAAPVLLAVALAFMAAGLLTVHGSTPVPSGVAVALAVLGLGLQYLPRPMYVVVTDRRLICTRLSRLSRKPTGSAFAVSLADLRILKYRTGKYGTSVRCQILGRRSIRLHVGRAGRKDFAEVELALARSAAVTKLDPPWPSAESFSTAAGGR